MNNIIKFILLLIVSLILTFLFSLFMLSIIMVSTIGSESFYIKSLDESGFKLSSIIKSIGNQEVNSNQYKQIDDDSRELFLSVIRYANGSSNTIDYEIDFSKYGFEQNLNTELENQLLSVEEQLKPLNTAFKILRIVLYLSIVMFLIFTIFYFMINRDNKKSLRKIGYIIAMPSLVGLIATIIMTNYINIDNMIANITAEIPKEVTYLMTTIIHNITYKIITIMTITLIIGFIVWISSLFVRTQDKI